jgi:hypothetical protein
MGRSGSWQRALDTAIGSHHLATIDEPIDREIIDREIAD